MSIRVAVVGAGRFGVVHLRAFSQLAYSGVAELAAIAEANPHRAEELKKEYPCPIYTDYRVMLEKEEIDAVGIATPDHLHKEISVAAATAGKHVLVEKPLDMTIEGCNETIMAAKNAGVLLQVDFHKRYDPDHRAVEARVRAGDLGEILYGSVYMEDRIEVPSEWFTTWADSSSPTWFLGVHFYDLARWIIKSDVVSVYATGTKKRLIADFGIDAFDCTNAKVNFKNGATFNFDTSWILPGGFESIVNQEIRIVGTKGCFECDSQDRGLRSCIIDEGMRTYNNNFSSKQTDIHGRTMYRGYGIESIQDFAKNVAYLKGGGSFEALNGKYPSGEDGREATRIACAVHESIRIDTGGRSPG
jgi:predicted dehydrogenase